jgi:CheY-like chemotaxis protein
VVLRAADTGVGMSDEVRTRIFDPFFTTKEVGKGTGLGLSTVYGIVRQMDGAVQVQSAPGAGTTFAIYLPAAVGTPRPAPAPQAGQERGGSGHILLVEDEEAVREAAQRILSSHGYTIRAASSAAEALQILAGAERVVDLLLTDLVMPNMNGVELARRAREQIPHLKVLFTTGYTEAALPEPGSGPGRTGVLLKPFGSQALLRKVREMLAD